MPTVVQSQLADRLGVSGPFGALVNAGTAGTKSAWFPLGGIRPWSVTIKWNGTGSFTARLHVSNAAVPTAGDTTEPQLYTDITASTALAFNEGYANVMVELNAAAGGAVVSASILAG